ncbi:MAG: UvrD-helicase domain-containing protein [Candidatus Rokubacteria bacterium]|nr:UvrD-helicase domain-containing protein [Candidatus Rokubacteria bacterium]
MLQPERLLEDLNPPQLEAVTAGDGPFLVLAGAGSGKTRVITHRIACLIGVRGVSPKNVLAVTFTNKAAGEMARRVEALLQPAGLGAPWVGTFHATCVRMLRQHVMHLGRSRAFVIYDEDDRLSLIKRVLRDEAGVDRSLTPSAFAHRISYAKNRMLTVGDVERQARGPRETHVAQVYRLYQERLDTANAVDFDDLLLLTVRLLEEAPNVLAWYRGFWKHVLIDEYQDTNRAQYRIIRLLTGEHRNVFVVGDPDQSVYAFRGANIRNILDFENDYPGTRVIRLEQNYRSTKNILAIAADVIANNVARKDKTLWTENDAGERARLYRAWDEHEEANWVAQSVLGLREQGTEWDDVALFYRTNSQSRVLEDALRRARVPYVIVGGVRFYERKEVKDVLAYVRLAVNAGDDVAFNRAVQAPARGIGKTSLARLAEVATREGTTLLAMAATPPADVRGAARKGFEEFEALIARLARERASLTPPAFLDLVINESGYRGALKAEKSPEAEGRLENLEELVAAAEDYTHSDPDPSIEGFLDGVALVSDIDELEAGTPRVTLMTLHSAKGLEFEDVFLTGMEEGVFPHARSMNDTEEIEEERRLCYVGVTRAKRRLFLSYALHRRIHGYGMGEPSRFLREMPEEHLDPVNASRGPARPAEAVDAPAPDFAAEPHEDDLPLRVGARVRHARWGEGLVVGVVREGGDTIVTVGFASVGRKRLSLQYAHLEEL